jgi:DNA-binding GntR family transcriptional regulator
MDHRIIPGERVTIDILARELGVSPTPIREALARLGSDGLVRKRAMAGYRATPLLTRAEFEELFELRLLLECPAAARASARVTAGGLEVDALAGDAELPEHLSGDGYAGHTAFTAQGDLFHKRVDLEAARDRHRAAFDHTSRPPATVDRTPSGPTARPGHPRS